MTVSSAFWLIGTAGLFAGWAGSTFLNSFHWYHHSLNRCTRCGATR